MKSLINVLNEGLFDAVGDDRLSKEVNKDATAAFLNNCKGKYDLVNFKDGSVRVNGKLIITGLKSDKIHFNCRDFHGKLIIENCPNLTTLEGSFLEKMPVFDGSITINLCPSLTSLKGLPGMIKGDLSVTNCKKVKSWEGIDAVFGNLYWSGNGKKYSAEQLKNEVHVIKKVFCGAEEMEADVVEGMVTETLNNPWLQRLARQLKKYPYKEYSWRENEPDRYSSIKDVFRYGKESSFGGNSTRLLDKITSDDIDVYDMSDEKDKKELGKAFYDAYSSNNHEGADVILVYNEDEGEFIGGFGYVSRMRGSQSVGIEWINIPHNGSSEKVSTGTIYSKTEAREKLLRYGVGYTVVVINSGRATGTDTGTAWNIHKEREESRKGMINPGDVEQYKDIARENIKRYKDLIAQAKLARKKDENGEYDKIIDEYEKINTRIVALVRKVAKDPKSFSQYEITSFLTWVRDSKRYNTQYKPWKRSYSGPEYYGENGLMYTFKEFIDAYMYAYGNSYKSTQDESDLKKLENCTAILKEKLKFADEKLRGFGV